MKRKIFFIVAALSVTTLLSFTMSPKKKQAIDDCYYKDCRAEHLLSIPILNTLEREQFRFEGWFMDD